MNTGPGDNEALRAAHRSDLYIVVDSHGGTQSVPPLRREVRGEERKPNAASEGWGVHRRHGEPSAGRGVRGWWCVMLVREREVIRASERGVERVRGRVEGAEEGEEYRERRSERSSRKEEGDRGP